MPESLPKTTMAATPKFLDSLPEPIFKANFADFEMEPVATSTKIGGNLVSKNLINIQQSRPD